MMLTPDYLTTNQSEEGLWADHALLLGHCKTHDSLQGWTQFWGHWLWPPLPDKAIKLSFSTSPKTLVSTFLFSTGAQRPFQQHTEEPFTLTPGRRQELAGTSEFLRASLDPEIPRWPQEHSFFWVTSSICSEYGFFFPSVLLPCLTPLARKKYPTLNSMRPKASHFKKILAAKISPYKM